jgi:hypothetical protein
MTTATRYILRITGRGHDWYLDIRMGWARNRARATLFDSRINAAKGWDKFTPTVACDLIPVQVIISDGAVEKSWPAPCRAAAA